MSVTIHGGITSGHVNLATPPTDGVAAREHSPSAISTGPTPEAGGRIYTQEYYLPLDVLSVNVLMANRTYSAGTGVSFTSNVAMYKSDGTGKPAGTAFATFGAVTVPGDGTTVSVGPFPIYARGTDGKVVVVYSVPQGTTVAVCSSTQFGYYNTGTTTVSPTPSVIGANPSSTLSVRLDYKSTHRSLVVFGDSITVGYSSGTPVGPANAAFTLIGIDKVWNIDMEGIPLYGSLAIFADPVTYPYLWDGQAWSGNPDVVINLGTNDIPGQSLANMQTHFAAIVTKIQSLTTGKIYASTIPPQAAYADAGNVRTGFNTWLKANYVAQGITAVRDRAASQATGGVADNTTQTTLYSTYDSGDGTHLSAAGNVQEKTGWELIL